MENKINNKARVIAFYLPQYHPFPENDEWWGKGFTEWTNVGKAKPLYKGHYQPKVPTELGYYDLRLPIVREQQAQLAKEAGVEGFLYWHYWFGNGKRLMADVFDEVLNTGKPDLPFCLGWANHSWYAKNWNSDSTKGSDRLLIEQSYYGEDDYRQHFMYCLKAFNDVRYIKVNGKPLFYIFDIKTLPIDFIPSWRAWAIENGLPGIYFVGQMNDGVNYRDVISKGFDAATPRPSSRWNGNLSFFDKLIRHIKIKFRCPRPVAYSKLINRLIDLKVDSEEEVIPFIMPNWDHSPRSGVYDIIFHDCNPQTFYKHVCQVLNIVRNKDNKIIFLKSWNEWGEGNYMEPDTQYGKGYIQYLRKALEDTHNI